MKTGSAMASIETDYRSITLLRGKCPDCSNIQTKILAQVEFLQKSVSKLQTQLTNDSAIQNDILAYLKKIDAKFSLSSKDKPDEETSVKFMVKYLPTKSVEDFQTFNDLIKEDDELKNVFMERISHMHEPGQSSRHFVFTILKHMMTDFVAGSFSLTGKGPANKNLNLNDTEVFRILLNATMTLYPKESTLRLKACFSDYLSQTRTRISRRERNGRKRGNSESLETEEYVLTPVYSVPDFKGDALRPKEIVLKRAKVVRKETNSPRTSQVDSERRTNSVRTNAADSDSKINSSGSNAPSHTSPDRGTKSVRTIVIKKLRSNSDKEKRVEEEKEGEEEEENVLVGSVADDIDSKDANIVTMMDEYFTEEDSSSSSEPDMEHIIVEEEEAEDERGGGTEIGT